MLGDGFPLGRFQGALFGAHPGGSLREVAQEALFGAVPGSTLRGGSERPARPWAPRKGRSRARRCRSSRRRFGGTWTPRRSARSTDTRTAHRLGGASMLGAAGIDSTELARDEPLLCFGGDAVDQLRQRIASVVTTRWWRTGTVSSPSGHGAASALLRGCGRGTLEPVLRRRHERLAVRGFEGGTSCSGRLDDLDHGRPPLVGGTVWTMARVTTHRTSRECRVWQGQPRRSLRLRPAHTGLRLRVSLSWESSRT